MSRRSSSHQGTCLNAVLLSGRRGGTGDEAEGDDDIEEQTMMHSYPARLGHLGEVGQEVVAILSQRR